MGIKMNTYAGGQMTAGNDAILHDRAIANTGILHGCNITFMGANQIHIEKGYLLIKGRYCTVTEDTIQVAMSNSETELPGRLYVRADLADAQEPVKILSVAADPLPKLTQDENFNYDNGVWEVELATYTAGMTAIKDLTVTCEEVPEGASKKETAALLRKIDELTENITFPDGSGFYPDVQDGVRGYNTDPGRGADTFVPFKKSPILIGSRSGNGTINCTSINGYEKLSANDFLISITKYNTSVTGGGNMPSGKSFSVIPNKSYNPSTGILTLSGCAGSIYDHPATMATTLTVDIYLK